MEQIRNILEMLQFYTGEIWRAEIYCNDHITYKFYCPSPDKFISQTEIQGSWVDELIEDEYDYKAIENEIIRRLKEYEI